MKEYYKRNVKHVRNGSDGFKLDASTNQKVNKSIEKFQNPSPRQAKKQTNSPSQGASSPLRNLPPYQNSSKATTNHVS